MRASYCLSKLIELIKQIFFKRLIKQLVLSKTQGQLYKHIRNYVNEKKRRKIKKYINDRLKNGKFLMRINLYGL